MAYDLVTDIIKQKKPVFILSPHFDDAALSCGTLLQQLHGKIPVTIVNVFTSAHEGPYTLSARRALLDAGYANAVDLYEARRKEDEEALAGMGKIVNLDIEEALYRRKKKSLFGKFLPELRHIYPIYRLHVTGKIQSYDFARKQMSESLRELIPAQAIVFAPYGIGGHVDHKLLHEVALDLFPNCLIYSDFPYNVRLSTYGETIPDRQRVELLPDMQKKSKMIQLYRTQFMGLFPEGKLPEHKEVYFLKK